MLPPWLKLNQQKSAMPWIVRLMSLFFKLIAFEFQVYVLSLCIVPPSQLCCDPNDGCNLSQLTFPADPVALMQAIFYIYAYVVTLNSNLPRFTLTVNNCLSRSIAPAWFSSLPFAPKLLLLPSMIVVTLWLFLTSLQLLNPSCIRCCYRHHCCPYWFMAALNLRICDSHVFLFSIAVLLMLPNQTQSSLQPLAGFSNLPPCTSPFTKHWLWLVMSWIVIEGEKQCVRSI